jgi:predicted CXXCH cytochrome family protein
MRLADAVCRGWRRWSALGAVALLSACPAFRGEAPPVLPTVDGATVVGTAVCLDCHADVQGGFAGAHLMAMSSRSDSCEICHGAGSRHAESTEAADIVGAQALRDLEPASRSAICLQCHTRALARFRASAHARAGVSCWECHPDALHTPPTAPATLPAVAHGWETTHAPDDGPRVTAGEGARQTAFCLQCHGEIEAELALQYHHPVPEGTMGCVDCHAVHGEEEWTQVEGRDARCLSCHEEIGGPFLFEHYALEEGCSSCHAPHGSMVDKMLVQEGNGLCEQCHFDSRYPLIGAVDHTGFLSGGAFCYDCHFQVHGSNTDENFNPLRIEERVRERRRR